MGIDGTTKKVSARSETRVNIHDEDGNEWLSDYLRQYYVSVEKHDVLRAQLTESERERYATLRALIACVSDAITAMDGVVYQHGAIKVVKAYLRSHGAAMPEGE